MNESLFRQSAIQYQGQGKWGELFVSQPPGLRLLMWVIATITVVALALLVSGEYQRKVAVSGVLAPERGLITLAAPANATVAQVLTGSGERVEAGQPLLRLLYEAGGPGTNNERLIQAWQVQLTALQNERRDEQARQQKQDHSFSQRYSQLTRQLEYLDAMLTQAEAMLDLRSKAVDRARQLAEQGSLAIADAEAVQALMLEQGNRVSELQMQISQVVNQQETLRADQDIATLGSQQALARLNSREAELQQMQVRIEQEHGAVLNAPVSGVVSATALQAGMSVAAGAQLISILPESSGLMAELEVPSSAIGFIQPGQAVSLRFAAFPYQKFGVLGAVVHEVAASSRLMQSGAYARPEQLYRVTAVLDSQTIKTYGQARELLAGMELEADVRLDRRSLLEWLLEPLFSIRGSRS